MVLIMPNLRYGTRHPELESGIAVSEIFQANDGDIELMFTEEISNLRMQLKKADMSFERWWDVFDEIQSIDITAGIPVVLGNLQLPADVEPFMNNDEVIYYRDGRKLERIKLIERYIVDHIDYYETDGQIKREIFDDRGFVSKIVWFENNQIVKAKWLTPAGETVMTQLKNENIEIESNHQARFDQQKYNNINEIKLEFTKRHVEKMPQKEALIIDQMHFSLFPMTYTLIDDVTKVVVMMTELASEALAELLNNAPVTLAFPTQAAEKQYWLALDAPKMGQSKVISPYPAELNLGISNEQPTSEILLNHIDIDETQQGILIAQLGNMLAHDETKVVHAIIDVEKRNADLFEIQFDDWLSRHFDINLSSVDYLEFVETMKRGKTMTESEVMEFLDQQYENENREPMTEERQSLIIDTYQLRQRMVLEKKTTIDDQVDLLHTARIYVDLGVVPDAQVQTQALSAGVPQITRGESDFVTLGVNGFVIDDVQELPYALSYFIDDLHNWNTALIENVAKIQEYSEAELIDAWEGVIGNG